MLDVSKIGVVFQTYDGPKKVAGVRKLRSKGEAPEREVYIVNDVNSDYTTNDIYSADDLNAVLEKQPEILEALARQEERERLFQAECERAKAIELERRNLYGFTDGMTRLQSSRVLNVLMTPTVFRGERMTRRDFVLKASKMRYTASKEDNVISYYGSRFNVKESKPKTVYYINADDNTCYVVTKTEYDFFNHINNKEELK